MPRVNFVGGAALATFGLVGANGPTADGLLIGSLMYIVGTFTTVTDKNGTYARAGGACLDMTTGLWTAWNANIINSSTGVTYIQTLCSDGTYLYVGGRFDGATGAATSKSCVRYTIATGVIDATWNLNVFEVGPFIVMVMRFIAGLVYIGGSPNSGTVGGVSWYGLGCFSPSTGNTAWRPGVGDGIQIAGDGVGDILDLGNTRVGIIGQQAYDSGGVPRRAQGFISLPQGPTALVNGNYPQNPKGWEPVNHLSNTLYGPGMSVRIGSTVYAGGAIMSGVKNIPAYVAAPDSRTGWFACDLSANWINAWNPQIQDQATNNAQAMVFQSSDGNLIMAGRFAGTSLAVIAYKVNTTDGAFISAFSLTYDAGQPGNFGQDYMRSCRQYGSMLIFFGAISAALVQGRVCNNLLFTDVTTGNIAA